MEYMDEEIIRLRNKNREINNLEYGVYIKGDLKCEILIFY